MKVTVRSNDNVTSNDVKNVIDSLNDEYKSMGLHVKNMTMYVRFADETGKTVEPTQNGNEIEAEFTIKHTKEVKNAKH